MNYNQKSAAVKRLLKEAANLSKEPSDKYSATPLEVVLV
jgi:hypothetical protein